MTPSANFYWDTCVFIRYLSRQPSGCLTDIDLFVEDVKKKNCRIYYSTILFAELKPRFFVGSKYGSVHDLIADLGGFLESWEPTPDILIAAGELRDIFPVNPNPKDENNPGVEKRVVGMGDAIHLMTCCYLRDVLEIKDIVFHTFDKGRGKAWEGKCVPLIGFENWYPPHLRNGRVADVCGLTRTEPRNLRNQLFWGMDDPAIANAPQSKPLAPPPKIASREEPSAPTADHASD